MGDLLITQPVHASTTCFCVGVCVSVCGWGVCVSTEVVYKDSPLTKCNASIMSKTSFDANPDKQSIIRPYIYPLGYYLYET